MTRFSEEPWWYDGDSAVAAGFEHGAAVVFGLLGMAQALRDYAPRCCDVCGLEIEIFASHSFPTLCSTTCSRQWFDKHVRGVQS